LCSDLESIRFSTLQVLADFEADNVVYLELRTTPRAIPGHNITKREYVETILSCIKEYEQSPQHRLRTRLILSVDRRNTLDQANEVIELAKAYQTQGVCAVDLCGDPARTPIDHLAPAFQEARRVGLKLTLHFAEAPISSSDKELWMLLSWQPDRLGHVINVNDALKAEIVKSKIGVELCLSCNVHAKMITGSYSDHHFGWWKDNHVGVALCVSSSVVTESTQDANYGRLTTWEYSAARFLRSIILLHNTLTFPKTIL
jgi:adenosine deaminase